MRAVFERFRAHEDETNHPSMVRGLSGLFVVPCMTGDWCFVLALRIRLAHEAPWCGSTIFCVKTQ